MRVFRSIALAGAAALAIVGIAGGLASADPTTPVPTCAVTAAGSQTLQQVGQDWQAHYVPSGTNCAFASWDATGTSPIQAKGSPSTDPNCSITRPNGSGNGIAAVIAAAKTGDGNVCIDLARSSRSLTSAEIASGADGHEVGLDAVTWAATSGGHAPANLTTANLKAIYSASAPCPTWSSLGLGTSTNTIKPIVPQAGSGTRSSFETAIGLTDATLGNCVDTTTQPEENEGTNCVFWNAPCTPPGPGTVANPDVVYPYSIGSYICQVNLGHCTSAAPGSLTIRSIDSKAPTTGSGTSTTINTAFGTAFFRPLLLVDTEDASPTSEASEKAFLNNFACAAAGQADITANGFLKRPATDTTCPDNS